MREEGRAVEANEKIYLLYRTVTAIIPLRTWGGHVRWRRVSVPHPLDSLSADQIHSFCLQRRTQFSNCRSPVNSAYTLSLNDQFVVTVEEDSVEAMSPQEKSSH